MLALHFLGSFIRLLAVVALLIIWFVLSLNCMEGRATAHRAIKLYSNTFLVIFAEALAGAILRGWFVRALNIRFVVTNVVNLGFYSAKVTSLFILISLSFIGLALVLEHREGNVGSHNR